MKKLIASLLLASMVPQYVFADVGFLEGKDKRPSAFTVLVIPDGTENVRFAIAINGKFHRYLGNKKVYNVAKLNEFSALQAEKVRGDKIRKLSFTLGGAILTTAGGVLLAGKYLKGDMRVSIFYLLALAGAGMLGVSAGAGFSDLHDFFYVTGSERQTRSFFSSAEVTSDKPVIYQTRDAVLAISAFEDGLEESNAGVEKESEDR